MNLTTIAALPGSGGGALAWQPAEVWRRPLGTPKPVDEPVAANDETAPPTKAKSKAPTKPYLEPRATGLRESLVKAATAVVKVHGRSVAVGVLNSFGYEKITAVNDEDIADVNRAMWKAMHADGHVWHDGPIANRTYTRLTNMTNDQLEEARSKCVAVGNRRLLRDGFRPNQWLHFIDAEIERRGGIDGDL